MTDQMITDEIRDEVARSLEVAVGCAALHAADELHDPSLRMSSLQCALMADWMIQHGWPALRDRIPGESFPANVASETA